MERIRVMVVEDDIDNQQTIVRYLGAKPDIEIVAVAGDGVEALALIKMTRPDVLVLDMIMPLKDGFVVMEQIRVLGLTGIRIIVLSGLRRDHQIRRALDLGAYHYLVKPYDLNLLYTYIVQHDPFADSPIGMLPNPPIDEDAALDELMSEILGVPLHAKGGRYLHTAVRIASGMGSINGRITKELYPAVAQLFSTSPSRVERAIRHIIETAWDHGNIRTCGLFEGHERPSNGEVIAILTSKYCKNLRKQSTYTKYYL